MQVLMVGYLWYNKLYGINCLALVARSHQIQMALSQRTSFNVLQLAPVRLLRTVHMVPRSLLPNLVFQQLLDIQKQLVLQNTDGEEEEEETVQESTMDRVLDVVCGIHH